MENISKERRLEEGRRERNIQNFVSRRLKRGKYKVGQAGGGRRKEESRRYGFPSCRIRREYAPFRFRAYV